MTAPTSKAERLRAAWDEYLRIVGPAWAEYARVMAPAWAEYVRKLRAIVEEP